jgi:hypothetical protein
VALATFVGSTLIQQREAKKRERRANQARERQSRSEAATRAYEARISRRQQIREARVRQAQIENVAATSGQTGSSAAVAATGSLQSQLGTNVGSINTALAKGEGLARGEEDILRAQQKTGTERLSGIVSSVSSRYI